MKTITHKSVEVLELRSQGMSVYAIAEHLDIPVSTVDSRLQRARHRLGAIDNAHAVGIAMASGLIGGPEALAVKAVPDRYRPLAEFVEDYKILRGRGLSQAQIAELLHVKTKTVGQLVARARAAKLLPPAKRRGERSC